MGMEWKTIIALAIAAIMFPVTASAADQDVIVFMKKHPKVGDVVSESDALKEIFPNQKCGFNVVNADSMRRTITRSSSVDPQEGCLGTNLNGYFIGFYFYRGVAFNDSFPPNVMWRGRLHKNGTITITSPLMPQ